MDRIESQLEVCQWLGGTQPSSHDAEQFVALNKNVPDVDLHPNTFAWYSFVSKYTDKVRASWPTSEVSKHDKINEFKCVTYTYILKYATGQQLHGVPTQESQSITTEESAIGTRRRSQGTKG